MVKAQIKSILKNTVSLERSYRRLRHKTKNRMASLLHNKTHKIVYHQNIIQLCTSENNVHTLLVICKKNEGKKYKLNNEH